MAQMQAASHPLMGRWGGNKGGDRGSWHGALSVEEERHIHSGGASGDVTPVRLG